MKLLIIATAVGIACFVLGFLADALLQADFIRQKDDEILQLKAEKKAIQDQLYRRPDLAYDGNRYSRPTVEIIDIPKDNQISIFDLLEAET